MLNTLHDSVVLGGPFSLQNDQSNLLSCTLHRCFNLVNRCPFFTYHCNHFSVAGSFMRSAVTHHSGDPGAPAAVASGTRPLSKTPGHARAAALPTSRRVFASPVHVCAQPVQTHPTAKAGCYPVVQHLICCNLVVQ